MQYSNLTNEELERVCYASPENSAAIQEALSRLAALTDAEARIEELESRNADLEDADVELIEALRRIEELEG